VNRETRDKFASGTDQADLTTGNACWETAPRVFAQLAEDFGPFDLDLAADSLRHLCPVWFGPDSPVCEYDALEAQWSHYGGNGYSNPPYGPFVQRVLRKARIEADLGSCASTLLLPLRVTRAFRSEVPCGASDLIFPDKRLVFFENGVPRLNEKEWREKGRARADSALFDSIIVRYRLGRWASPVVSTWRVPVHVMAEDLERAAARRRRAEAAA
jgi:hypothetical protein